MPSSLALSRLSEAELEVLHREYEAQPKGKFGSFIAFAAFKQSAVRLRARKKEIQKRKSP